MDANKLYFEVKGEQLLKELGITKTEFANRMGIQKQNVNALFSTKSVIVLRRASEVLGVPFELLASYPHEPKFEGCTFFSDIVAKGTLLRVVLPYDRWDDLFTIENGRGEDLGMDDSCELPMYDVENRQFDFVIDLKTKRILSWEYDSSLRIWAKVRDYGTYELQDKSGKPLLQIVGYVPNEVLPPGEKGFGDFIELCISETGVIENWLNEPDLMVFAEEGTLPRPIRSNKWSRAKQILMDIKSAKLSEEELDWIKSRI